MQLSTHCSYFLNKSWSKQLHAASQSILVWASCIMVVFAFLTDWPDKRNYVTWLFLFSGSYLQKPHVMTFFSCQLAEVSLNVKCAKYFWLLGSEQWDSGCSRSHCGVRVLRMRFNHFNSWRVCLPSGWSAVLPDNLEVWGLCSKVCDEILKTMNHRFGES